MKHRFVNSRAQSLRGLGAAVVLACSTAAASAGMVDPNNVQLADRNSLLSFDLTTDAGHNSWIVDDHQKLKKEWFWYRSGDMAESSIDKLQLVGFAVSDTNPFSDTNVDTLGVLYREVKQGNQDGRFEVELSFKLRGGSADSGESDLAETIVIRNLTNAPLSYTFFQYVDLDLGATDTVQFANPNAVQQSGSGGSANETVITPASSHREAAMFGATLTKLNDMNIDNLNDNVGPVVGDVTWAYQWDVVIPARGSFIISKDKKIIPEPTVVPLLLMGAAAMGVGRRRKLA